MTIRLHPICCGCEDDIGTVQHGHDWYCAVCCEVFFDAGELAEPDEVWVPDPADIARDRHEQFMEGYPNAPR